VPPTSSPDASRAYRWTILVVSTLILMVTMGLLVNGLSIFFVPMGETEGWGRADIALINSIGLLGLALGCLVMGFAADRYGVRRIALMGIAVTGSSVCLASWATELWQFYLLFFIAGALGGGALAAPLMTLIGNWFVVGAGLAIGIASAGQAMGQGGMPFSGAFLIDALGWRGALFAQGLFILVVLFPLGFILRDIPTANKPEALPDQTPSGLPNTLIVIWMSVAVVFCCTTMSTPLMHLVPLIQGNGFSAPQAGGVFFLMLMVAIVGRVAFGKLTDIIGGIPTYLLASAWQTTLVFGFVFIERLDVMFIYAAIYGFGYAGVMTSIIVTTRNITAPAKRASSMGIVMAFGYVGHGVGGFQGGYFYDLTGAYDWTFANAALAGVINLIIVGSLWLTINRRPTAAMA